MHHAAHILGSTELPRLNTTATTFIEPILSAGQRAGVFRADVDALDVHMLISAYCVFRTANRHTFRAVFGRDLADEARRSHYRTMVGDLVVAYLTIPTELTADAADAPRQFTGWWALAPQLPRDSNRLGRTQRTRPS